MEGPGLATPAIQTRELSKRYGRTEALASLTLDVAPGETFGLLGPNGAGKTTAVKLLLGLARPSGGQGRVLGAALGNRLARRRVGYLPELFRYQGWLTAREVLGLHCRLARIPTSQRQSEIGAALTTVALNRRGDDRVSTFSKGMQQRLGLAVALLGNPRLVVLDEPTSALDPVGRHDVRGIIASLRDRGTAVLLNSHLLGEVELVCQRVAIVSRGAVVAQGSLEDLLADPHEVRIRVTGWEGDTATLGSGAGTWEGDILTMRDCPAERIPDVVTTLVEGGGRVYSVEPQRTTLEQRFLAIVGEP